jgi:group II intron reverse transcriptase/maturase
MDDREKSDGLVVPVKPSNNAQGGAAEAVEGSGPAKGNATGETRPGLRAGQGALSELGRVRQVAKQDKDARFTALLHHVDVERLRAAYFALRPKAAPGVDGVTWHEYGQELEGNLEDLHARVHRGGYRAKPSRRVFIPKPDGRQRPLGVASLEDKILQRAVVEVLNAIYEQDFVGFSYGFRPGRKPHDALDALAFGINRKRVNWVLDADFRDYFSSLDHRWLERFLEHRIADRRVLRLVQKWLAAGVIEEGTWSAFEEGVPQGASASPLLANVYLHYVFDLWAHQWRIRRAHGDVVIVRFADDFVVGFEHRDDAERFWGDLRERLAQFSLELNAEKTRLIEFGRYAAPNRRARGLGKPETFQFLGLTHICAKAHKTGRFKLKRITDSKRVRAKLRANRLEMRHRMHQPIPEQGRWLASVLRGHYQYYAVPDNSEALTAFRRQVTSNWLLTLRRRSQRDRLTWDRMRRLADRWLPQPQILHPWPEQRFAATTQGRSPVR